MNKNSDSETNAAVQTAGRELVGSALQRSKPLVAIAAALIGPVLGLFRRRSKMANEANQLKLETYSSRPAAATAFPASVPIRRHGGSGWRKGKVTIDKEVTIQVLAMANARNEGDDGGRGGDVR